MVALHKSIAGSKPPHTHTLSCVQTKPERLHFRVTACSGIHINFLKFGGFHKIRWSCLRASRFPQMMCCSMNESGPQGLLSSNSALRGSTMYKTTLNSSNGKDSGETNSYNTGVSKAIDPFLGSWGPDDVIFGDITALSPLHDMINAASLIMLLLLQIKPRENRMADK